MKKLCFVLLLVIVACTPVKKAQKAYETGNLTETISVCRQALKSDSTNVELLELLGKTYFQMGSLDSARYFSQKAFKYDSTSSAGKVLFDVCMIKGDSLFAQKDYRAATSTYEEALRYNRNEPGAMEKVGDCLYQRGLHDKALQQYRKTLLSTADSTSLDNKINSILEAHKKADKLVADGYSNLKRKRYKSAKSRFEKALKLKPDHKEARYGLYMSTGHIYYKEGKVGSLWDAIEQYGLAAALMPERSEPHYFMGLAYHRKDKKEYDNAFREFEKAIELEPGSEYARLAAAKLAEEQRRKKLLEDFWNAGKKTKN